MESVKGFGTRCYYESLFMVSGGGTLAKQWFNKHQENDVKDFPDQTGKVALITGGNRGIGFEVVKKLLQSGLQVFIGCRNPESLEPLIKSYLTEKPNVTGRAECLKLDLTSLNSVKTFVSEFLSKKCSLHYLINNAGIMFSPFKMTDDGYESHFQVNYLGHFLLTHLLLPKLRESASEKMKTRIINVTSIVHFYTSYNLETMLKPTTANYSPHNAYALSKLAQVMFTTQLSRLLKDENVEVFSVHPGAIHTDLWNNVWWRNLMPALTRSILKTPEQGADSIIYPVLSPSVEGSSGSYFDNSSSTKHAADADDEKKCEELFSCSCEHLSIKKFGNPEM